MGTNRNAHLSGVASAVRGQINKPIVPPLNGPAEWPQDEHEHCEAVWRLFGYDLYTVVSAMGPAGRGKIVACNHPRFVYWTALENGVYREYTKITPRNGDELLSLLAARLIAMAIVDQLRAEELRYRQDDAREAHLLRGEGSDLVEWLNRNPLLG